MDMSAAYAKGVGLALPGAAISYDRFHVVKMAVEAMDEVRRTELREQPAALAQLDTFTEGPARSIQRLDTAGARWVSGA